MYRYTGTTDFKDYDNGKTLSDLHFMPNEVLSAFKKNSYAPGREPLLNEYNNDMSDRCYAIFREWYHMFSEEEEYVEGEGEGAVTTTRRVMTPKGCAAFTRTCTEDNCTEEDGRVVGLFLKYDTDKDNRLTEEDFLAFYRHCCKEKEDVVRHNLYAHGYRSDLRKNVRDEDSECVLQLRKGIE